MEYYTHQTFLKHYVKKTHGDILEFGCGDGSTGLILDAIKGTERKLISYENDRQWFEKMTSLYPPSEQHSYVFVADWDEIIPDLPTDDVSVVFIDSSPWQSRVDLMRYFKNDAEYIIIHDVDYFPKNLMFGRIVSNTSHLHETPIFDFSEDFHDFRVYYPKKPWSYWTGPPTLVGTNLGMSIDDVIDV